MRQDVKMITLIPGKLYRYNNSFREYFYPNDENRGVKIILNGDIFFIISRIDGIKYDDYLVLASNGEIGCINPFIGSWEIVK